MTEMTFMLPCDTFCNLPQNHKLSIQIFLPSFLYMNTEIVAAEWDSAVSIPCLHLTDMSKCL